MLSHMQAVAQGLLQPSLIAIDALKLQPTGWPGMHLLEQPCDSVTIGSHPQSHLNNVSVRNCHLLEHARSRRQPLCAHPFCLAGPFLGRLLAHLKPGTLVVAMGTRNAQHDAYLRRGLKSCFLDVDVYAHSISKEKSLLSGLGKFGGSAAAFWLPASPQAGSSPFASSLQHPHH